jgi:hypothetical protein
MHLIYNISVSCDIKIYGQLIGHKGAEDVMVLCNPCRCKYFLNGKRFSLIFAPLRRFIDKDSIFQSLTSILGVQIWVILLKCAYLTSRGIAGAGIGLAIVKDMRKNIRARYGLSQTEIGGRFFTYPS